MEDKNEIQVELPELAEEIARMVKADQEMREKGLAKAKQADWSDFDKNVDIKNTARMKEIVEEVGWPSVAKVGKHGFNDAWLLVQHADEDVDFQELCLKLMKALPESELQLDMVRRCIAYLEDRVRWHRGELLLYGTQFEKQEDDSYEPLPMEDPDYVEERRKLMGLDTINQQKKRLRKYLS